MSSNHPLVISAASVSGNSVAAGKKTSVQLLIPPDRTPHFNMRCFTIASGGSMPLHTNSVEHEQYIIGGTAEVIIGEQTHKVQEGDVVFIPAGVAHSYRALGETPFKFLCMVPNQVDEISLVDGPGS